MTHNVLALCSLASARRVPVRGARRTAYTLFELLIVATLLVLIASLTVPSLIGALSDARLDASSDMIRARMADARSMAMEKGCAVRFGFSPGTGQFQIAADDSPLWGTFQTSDAVEDDEHMRGELLQDVIFGTDVNSISNATSATPSNNWQLGGIFLPDGTGRASVNPDGTTVDDVTFYFGRVGFSPMAVQFRGLTGAVRIFDPTADGEQP
jgi:Tfp pilus assembly protein FimT